MKTSLKFAPKTSIFFGRPFQLFPPKPYAFDEDFIHNHLKFFFLHFPTILISISAHWFGALDIFYEKSTN